MNAKRAAILVVFALALCIQARADDPFAPFRGHEESLRRMADQGDAAAQHLVGWMYAKGEGVPQDAREAVKWYCKAAEQGLAIAQLGLGTMYSLGQGVPQDSKEGAKWIRKAAEQGLPHAQLCLALMYKEGGGVAQNFEEAAKCFRLAAEQGIAEAQTYLGLAYDHGQGLPQDYEEGAKWCRKAAEQGDAMAQYGLGVKYYRGEGVAQNYVESHMWFNLAAAKGIKGASENRDAMVAMMIPQQIAEAQTRAAEWQPVESPSSASLTLPKPNAWSGTGFIVSTDGYIVTNDHVASQGSAFFVKTEQGEFSARLVRRDTTNDLALLKVDNAADASQVAARLPAFQPLPVADSADVGLGDSVFTIGFPNIDIQGIEPKLTKGEINSLAGMGDDPCYFQTSVQIQPGNSGGPLIDEKGNVIGVVSAKLADIESVELTGQVPQNVNYAVKSSILLAFLNTVPELRGKLIPPSANKRPDTRELTAEVVEATVLLIVE